MIASRCLRVVPLGVLVSLLMVVPGALAQERREVTGGELRILDAEGAAAPVCPLKYTDVQADIVGYVGRVHVKQVFHNPTGRKIEAVYVFPLPQDAAVDDMVMVVGDRRIVGQIKEREEAREIYEDAKAAGYVASLLDQERPNIFTQSVANIEPGVEVSIELSYVETLKYEEGVFTWVFPMVVGPRYIPGGGSPPAVMTRGAPTDEVPDADRITPPVTPKGKRAGHDISVAVRIDAGMEVYDLESELHEVTATRAGSDPRDPWEVTLKNETEIPNRDFILHYRLATDEIADAFLVHEDARGKFFTLVLQPPRRVVPRYIVPRELVFVLDTSGSMSGLPIEKAKEVMDKLIGTMQPGDTFNIITFAGDTHVLWDRPQPASDKNIAAAQEFIESRQGSGGTEMMKAIHAALVQTVPQPTRSGVAPIRVVCFMTDGYVGNDMEIVAAVKDNADTTRVFSFGVGNSVNRFLLDGMAQAGRGDVEYVSLESNSEAAVERFHTRVLAPVLTDIEIDWGDLPVADVYPQLIPDLFSAKPMMIHGRLNGPARGTITLHGNTGAGAYEDTIDVAWPESPPDHAALPSLWARAKVADLMMQDYAALQQQTFPEALKQEVTALGLEYRLMTQFTSFVAVEQMRVTAGGEAVTIDVPVEMPEGVSYEGVFAGDRLLLYGGKGGAVQSAATPMCARLPMRRAERGRAGGAILGRQSSKSAESGSADSEEGSAANESPTTQQLVEARLAEPLRDLADKVAKDGVDGDLTVGKLKVVKHRVDVMVYLSDVSEKTLAALKAIGFEQTSESKAVKLLIGSLDVRKLEELAKLDGVLRVRPVVMP